MNYRMILKSIGAVLCIEAACMLPSLGVSLLYKEIEVLAFILSILIISVIGLSLLRIATPNTSIYTRDGFALVALGWILVSVLGALPFVLSGSIPAVMDAVFESVSGFSTTGATILRDIEALPQGILFWRSFTHWMGGMGVLVLMIAILPSVQPNPLHILRAETPGPSPGKFVPKIRQTAEILYLIYLGLTAVEVVLFLLGGMSLFDALIHAFGAVGTGGFSSKNASLAAYNSVYIDIITTFFMLLSGVNFSLYYTAFKQDMKSALRDEELRFYLTVVAAATILLVLNLYGRVYPSLGAALRHAFFQVGSITTTTGYVTADYALWPAFSQVVLLLLMFIGGSAGSAAGGLKCIRIILLFKIIKREVTKIHHPRAVQTVKINGRVVDEETLWGVMAFFFFAILLSSAAILLLALDGNDMTTSTTAAIASINNIGPGLGLVGPTGNFAHLSVFSKAVLSLLMIVGRLEIYPLMLLFLPSFWRRSGT